jgi:hypothetical protein
VILLYSRLFENQQQLQSTEVYFEKSRTIFDQILELDSAFLDKQYLPIIGHSHGAVLALHARERLPPHLRRKVPLILFGMGAWRQASFLEALGLLKTSVSPTIIYYRIEDGFVLVGSKEGGVVKNEDGEFEINGLKNMIDNGFLHDDVLKDVFRNKNNFVYITKDKRLPIFDPTGKTGHVFEGYFRRAVPLAGLLRESGCNWAEFQKQTEAVKLFSYEVDLIERGKKDGKKSLENCKDLLKDSQKLMGRAEVPTGRLRNG